MRFFDYIRLAFKNLSRQKSRTILTIVAITVGSLSVILMLSLLISVRQSLIDQFNELGAFNLVTVTRDPNSTDDNAQLLTSGNNSPSDEGKLIDDTAVASFKKITNVVDVTPILGVWVKTIKLQGKDKKMWSNVMGYDPSSNVFNLPILAGRNLNSGDMDKIVVGMRFVKTYEFAAKPSELIGKKVILMMETGGGNAPDWGPLPEKPPMNADKSWYESQSQKTKEIPVEIIGVADNSSMDDSQNFINIAFAKRLMTSVSWQGQECNETAKMSGNCSNVVQLVKEDNTLKSGYGSVIINVNDTANLQAVADQISKLGYGVTTAQTMLDQINRMMLMIGLVLGLIGGISLFVAAIGIINTMVMATYERIREIGVMRACGATRAVIRRLFTFEAALLGFWGGVLGIIICYGIIFTGKIIVEKYSASLGSLPIDRVGSIPWWLIVGVITFTTLIGLLSGLGPAIKAARLNPVDALRYE